MDRLEPVTAADHLAEADAARGRGDVDAVRAALVAAFAAARATDDGEAMALAALAMPTSQRFGVHPGQIPALLFEAYRAATATPTRARLAAALARSWVYGGDAVRAAGFAADAQRLAADVDDPEVTADALDAALLAHWGPDDLTTRLSLAARLDDVAAHLTDTDLRLNAHLWRLITAWECLDIVAVQRQLRALDIVAEESGSARAAFFAASRRAMHALAVDDPEGAEQHLDRTIAIGADLAEPDVHAVVQELRAMHMRVVGDAAGLRELAPEAEAFGADEGIPSVSAEAAVMWLDAGEPERAARIVASIAATGTADLARDVDFLLVTTSVVSVAAAVGLLDIARAGAATLGPYAGRGVVNAGAVTFHGVVDDAIHRARRALGDPDADHWRQSAQRAYRRIGAGWWERGLGAGDSRPAPTARRVLLRRDDTGRWSVGDERAPFALADLRGLHYLHELVERPGIEIGALTLSDAAAGHPGAAVEQADTGPLADPTAIAAYRSRLADLDAELDRADARGDQAGATRATEERDALLDQLRGATGLGGRARRAGATAERARVAVRKAIAATIAQIERHDASLGRHLRGCVHTGSSCRYEANPDQPVTWITR